jgi:hypothetical protein
VRNRVLERFWPTEIVELREVAEAKPLPAPPAPKPLGWGRAMVDYLNTEAPVKDRDPFRYDPNRLLPRSAMVRQVRIERRPLRPCMADVAELLERIETLTGVAAR